MSKIYILSAQQISSQQPLVDDWMNNPIFHEESHVRAIDPDFKNFLEPNIARRLGKVLKRALIVSQQAIKESEIKNLDAIITGTGLGCIENTEIFLDKLIREGEKFLNPTYFMQSTHNTISSLIAINLNCQGYNSTYAHKGISFECALQDAFLQLTNNKIRHALVGAHDEMTSNYFILLQKAGFLGQTNQTYAGETAVAMMLSKEKSKDALCTIESVEKTYGNINNLNTPQDIDFVMVGTNGNVQNDDVYVENCARLFPNIPLLQYKNIFGEGYSASALGTYVIARCLQKGEIPPSLFLDSQRIKLSRSEKLGSNARILLYNQFENKNHSFTLLSKC